MNIKPFAISILLAAPFGALAQHVVPVSDTVMKGSSIEVVQSYKPKVKQAPKPEWMPQLPPADTTHPEFNYEVPQQTLYYSYSSIPLRPLALGHDTVSLPFRNYVKVGGGNLSTIYLDAGIGGISGKNYEVPIHLDYLSQKGKIKYQQSMLSGLQADAFVHDSKNDWHFGLQGGVNQYYDYGFENTQGADSLKQTYTKVGVSADVKNSDSTAEFGYHPAISFSYYGARYNTSETTLGFDLPVSYNFDPSISAVVALKGAITNYNVNSTSTANNVTALVPGLDIHPGAFYGHALVGFGIGQASGVYVLPDLLAAYKVPDTRFTVSGGWQATLRQNTYEQLTTENPYLYNAYTVEQTRRDEVFLDIKGATGDHLSYNGRVSYFAYDQLPTFLNDIGNEKQFRVVYDDHLNALAFHAAARYQVASLWSAGLTGDFRKFSNGSTQYAWHEPNTMIRGDVMFAPSAKFTATAYVSQMAGIYALDPAGNVTKLPVISDLGVNGEYLIIPRLSVFVQINNLLNDKYQRWRGYQAYGINIYGGIRLKF